MKKLLLFIITFLLLMSPIYASDISTSVSGSSNIDANADFSITLNVSGENIWGLSGNLIYDSNKVKLSSNTGLNGFTAMVGTGFSLDSAEGKSGSFGILKLTFKATNSFAPGESSTIYFSGMKAASDSTKLTVDNCERTITVNVPRSSDSSLSSLKVNGSLISGFSSTTKAYDLGVTESSSILIDAVKNDSKASISGTGTKTLNYGNNLFVVKVTAENGSISEYKISINKKDNRSTNNYLKSLKVSNTSLNFNKSTKIYNFVLENKISSVSVSAEAEDSKAKVSGTGTHNLKDYLNVIVVQVTAENGSVRKYTININRKDKDGNAGKLSSNNKLSLLEIEGYNISFDSSIQNYSLSVENIVNKVKIKAVVDDKNSEIRLENSEPNLIVGENKIVVDVVAQNGDVRTYTINVIRKNDNPIVELKDLINTIEKTTAKVIELEIKDEENVVSKEQLNKLIEKKINLNISKYSNDKLLYVWSINGNSIKEAFDFNTHISFETENKDSIDKLTNYTNGVYLNFEHSGKLPEKTVLKINVSDKYKDGDIVNLYYYDKESEKMILKDEKLKVKGEFIEFTIEHCSEYFLTKANIGSNTFDYKMIIIIVETILIIVASVFLLIRKKI